MIDTLRVLFLEEPWPVVVASVALAAIAFLIARALQRTRAGIILAMGCLDIAFIALILSFAITTDHEHVNARLDQLLQLATDTDNPEFNHAADDNLTILAPGPTVIYQRPELDDWAQSITDKYGIRRHRVWSQTTTFPSPDTATTQAEIRTYVETMPTPARTYWDIHWHRTPDGWKAIEMHWTGSADGTPGPGSI
ncbi:nuclear transport factor 2 family protein [Mucisphaera calidilacus]|uniref:DUF4440 domain-containing protein n=1 Tax=Mucisphaera calidilacus TaxID=2527982 RepID=A0A518C123_9BACT|nr:nuclear transport factor 2 family protein [Mucisphaera calidilacus]QDU72910.1 hypothetical protein Pan265_27860 [Mucisphaera calidilacus]